jgi:hypothetical protein
MKTWLLKHALAISIAALMLPAAVLAQANDNDGCSDATLKGDYAFRVSGQIYGPGGVVAQQRDGVAMTHFDGAGKLTQVDFVMANGSPMSGPTDATTGFHVNETGTYQVNADCTGNAEIDLPAPPGVPSGAVIKLMFVVGKHGSVIHTIVSELRPPGATSGIPASIHSDAEKVGR